MISPVKQITDNFLTDEERNSAVWQSVRVHLERMLAKKRVENDDPKLNHIETATIRGHISCLNAMLALGKKPPVTVATNARPGARVDYGEKYG